VFRKSLKCVELFKIGFVGRKPAFSRPPRNIRNRPAVSLMLNPFERPVCRCEEAEMAGYVDERGNTVPSEDTNRTVKISGAEARQGLLGRPVLMVLVASLVLALIAWGGAEMFGESTDNDAATQVQETIPAAKDTVPSDQGTVDNTPSTGEQMQPAPTDTDPTPQSGSGG
jgi:hypothetical protein